MDADGSRWIGLRRPQSMTSSANRRRFGRFNTFGFVVFWTQLARRPLRNLMPDEHI
jgi:hypothetical protein